MRNCSQCSKENAGSQCGACKIVSYCSKECQKEHWSTHKQECSFKQEISVVVVDGSRAEEKRITLKEYNQGEWEDCIVPGMLGVPIKVKRINPIRQSDRNDREVGIFLMVNPYSGLADLKWQLGCGILCFAMKDKSKLSFKMFWDLYSYIFNLMDHYGEDTFNYVSFSRQWLKPEKFQWCVDNNCL
jgi:hypothetical protein